MVSRRVHALRVPFRNRQKKISVTTRERGDHRSFLPSNPSHANRDRKKNEQTGRIFGNARRTLARDVRAMPAKGASSRAWSSSSKQKSSSHRGSHHVLVVSRCVFLKWRLTRDCFFFFAKAQRRRDRERERKRERERETRGGKDATQTRVQKNIIQPFFFINFETLKSNALEIFFLKEREREKETSLRRSISSRVSSSVRSTKRRRRRRRCRRR